MEQAIYGDLFFAVNFTMDTLALYLTAKLLHLPLRLWRLALGGALGALYSVASLFLPDGNLFATAATVLVPTLICLAAFGWQNGRAFGRQLTAFWVLSLLLGGVMTAVCYGVGVWGEKQISLGGKVEPLMGDLPFWGLLVTALLIGAVVSLLLKWRKPTARSVSVTVEEEARTTLSALVDSGNLLTEPISGLPVIVVDRARAKTLLPSELAFLASDAPKSPSASSTRLRLIPCATASGETMLYGFVPKRLTVDGQPRNACIAVGDLPKGSAQDAILPAILL